MRRPAAGWSSKVEKVLLLLSSSRGGSSVTTTFVSRHPKVIGFFGEINPPLKLLSLTPPEKPDDQLGAADFIRAEEQFGAGVVEMMLGADLCRPQPLMLPKTKAALRGFLSFASTQFLEDLTLRLSYTYPDLKFDPGDIFQSMLRGLNAQLTTQSELGGHDSIDIFWAHFLSGLRACEYKVNPFHYDIDKRLLRQLLPNVNEAWEAPLNLIEEPPYVAIPLASCVRPSDFQERVLVIKTPSNAYRIEFLKKVFPNAKFFCLHLTRHPAASINGLIDGWQSNGFHYVPEPDFSYIDLDGSRHMPRFWKFDAPPLWRNLSGASITEICSFQWTSPHLAVLNAGINQNYWRVKFEDIVSDARRPIVLEAISQAIFNDSSLCELPWVTKPVMATEAPRPDRWKDREGVIAPLLDNPEIRLLAKELDYVI